MNPDTTTSTVVVTGEQYWTPTDTTTVHTVAIPGEIRWTDSYDTYITPEGFVALQEQHNRMMQDPQNDPLATPITMEDYEEFVDHEAYKMLMEKVFRALNGYKEDKIDPPTKKHTITKKIVSIL